MLSLSRHVAQILKCGGGVFKFIPQKTTPYQLLTKQVFYRMNLVTKSWRRIEDIKVRAGRIRWAVHSSHQFFWWSHQPNHQFQISIFLCVSSHQNVLYNSVVIADLKYLSQLNYIYSTFWWLETAKLVICNWRVQSKKCLCYIKSVLRK